MPFDLITASVPGTAHMNVFTNNHDAYQYHIDPQGKFITGVICDGCGSEKHSEVGSKLASNFILTNIINVLKCTKEPDRFFDFIIKKETQRQIKSIALNMHPNANDIIMRKIIFSHFLFTVIGFILTDETLYIFNIGDGVYFINDEKFILSPKENNQPDYLSYGIIDPNKDVPFNISKYPTETVNSFVIGSDGVSYLDDASEKYLPGREEIVGPISQIWEQDRFFKNPINLQRHLQKVQRQRILRDPDVGFVIHYGLLLDDTTLMVGRRNNDIKIV